MNPLQTTGRLFQSPIKRHIWAISALVLATFSALSPSLQAQDKPPLKIVVGFPPGGSADVLARMAVSYTHLRAHET